MKNIGKVVAISAILGFLALLVIPVNAVPAMPASLSDEAGERLTGLADDLEEQGYDMSAVRTAIESGDIETAHSLMQELMEELKSELPVRPADGRRGFDLTEHLDRLEEQGYDVSAIRAAIVDGDVETAHALMQQFMEEHGDELPAPPDGVHAGNGERVRPGMAL